MMHLLSAIAAGAALFAIFGGIASVFAIIVNEIYNGAPK
jgi:hypothetical protein